MREDIYSKFQKDGFLILEDFLNADEIDILRKAGTELAQNVPNECRKTVFSTTNTPQSKDTYFVESGDKVRYFFEEGALTEEGELKVSAEVSLNKVGHALHWLHPTFKGFSFSDKIGQLCRQLRFTQPLILQSMYIYKNPGIGSQVIAHQDSTFLYTEPNTLVGLWFALDDCTLENGCLWFIPGSQTSGVHRRYKRNPDPQAQEFLVYDAPPITYPASSFQPSPVPKGSCVVIHGDVVHKSEENKSGKPRHAYTFHIMEASSTFSPDNWLQSEQGFPLIYS